MIIKNPNWPEANQLAIYKDDGGVEPGTHQEQHQLVARADLKSSALNHSAILPPPFAKTEEYPGKGLRTAPYINYTCITVTLTLF